LSVIRVVVLHLCTKFEVLRPSRSEDMTQFSVSALIGLVTLTFNLWTLKLMRFLYMGKLPTNFGVSVTFCSLLMGQYLSDGSRDLTTLEVTVLVADAGLRAPSVYQV